MANVCSPIAMCPRERYKPSFRTAQQVKATASCIKCKCNLQKVCAYPQTLCLALGSSIICLNRHAHTEKRAKLSKPMWQLFQLLPLFLHFDICAQRQGCDSCEATVINSFPESSSAMRPIYESASVVLTFLGKTPTPLTVIWKGLRPKYCVG